jgi:hypothetical protein
VEYQQFLLREIREEFNHNLSQQLYTSDEAWTMVKNAKEEVIAMINECAKKIDEGSGAQDLSRSVFNHIMESGEEPTAGALKFLKDEIRTMF